MNKPPFCQLCYAAPPIERLGAYHICRACHSDRIVFCAEGQHDYGGAVDVLGSPVWCCRRVSCGQILGHQAIDERVVELKGGN